MFFQVTIRYWNAQHPDNVLLTLDDDRDFLFDDCDDPGRDSREVFVDAGPPPRPPVR